MPLVVIGVARLEEHLEIGEVVVHRGTLHARALGDGLDGRLRGAERLVELDRRFDNSLPGLGFGERTHRLPVCAWRRCFR
jgi:hypothetical protein